MYENSKDLRCISPSPSSSSYSHSSTALLSDNWNYHNISFPLPTRHLETLLVNDTSESVSSSPQPPHLIENFRFHLIVLPCCTVGLSSCQVRSITLHTPLQLIPYNTVQVLRCLLIEIKLKWKSKVLRCKYVSISRQEAWAILLVAENPAIYEITI